MAYTIPPAESRQRPSVVTLGVSALCVAAFAQVVNAALGFAVLGDQRAGYRKAYAGVTNGDQIVTATVGVTAGVLALTVVVAIALGVLALLDARGIRPARIITWVVGGLYLCCATLSLAGGAVSSQFSSAQRGTGNGPDPAEVTRIVKEAIPSWYSPTSVTLSALALLCVLGTVILLALPDANAYFRKPAQEWEPPVPFGGVG